MYLITLGIYLEIYEHDPIYFLSAPSLTWQAALKGNQVKLDLSTDIDIFFMAEKDVRGGICHAIYQKAKGNIKATNDCNENKRIFIS